MSVSPYTLNMLYKQGILDEIPMELAAPSPIGYMGNNVNPYLNNAMSGAAFQNYGQGDSYSFMGNNIAYNNSSIGIKNNSAYNAFGLQGIGEKASNNFYGSSDIGMYSNSGLNAFGLGGIGSRSGNTEMNAWGISGNAQQQVGQALSNVSSSPILKPLLALGLILIGGLSVKHAFFGSSKKAAKKAAKHTGFLTKINPKNWKIFNKAKV